MRREEEVERGHLFQEGGCEEGEPRAGWARALEITWRDSVASADGKESTLGLNVEQGARSPGWGRVGASTVAEPLLLPQWGQGPELFAVTKAGSTVPCGDGLSFLWDLNGAEREPRGGMGEGEGEGLAQG